MNRGTEMQAQGASQGSGKLGWAVAAVMTIIALGQCSFNNTLDSTDPAGSLMFVQPQSLNCRAGASQAEAIIRSLGQNETVRVLEEAAGWMRVDGSPNCWVSSRFLSTTAAEIKQPSSPPAQASRFLSSSNQPSPRRYDPPPPYESPSTFSGDGSVYYANCAAARAAGAAPVRRGDPGYAPKLDRDGDGIGCE